MSQFYEDEIKALLERAEMLLDNGLLEEATFMIRAAEEAARQVMKFNVVHLKRSPTSPYPYPTTNDDRDAA